jgi:hypothetical protein
MEGYKLQAMIAGIELGLFDFVDQNPGSRSENVCAKLELTSRGCRALVALLCAQGLLRKDADDIISLTSTDLIIMLKIFFGYFRHLRNLLGEIESIFHGRLPSGCIEQFRWTRSR